MDNFYNKISTDLNINILKNETENQYFSRLTYTALSLWLRTFVLNNMIFQKNRGISKKALFYKGKEWLDKIIELYPELSLWFYPEMDKHKVPIKIIRDTLYNVGELVNYGFTTEISLPNYKELELDNFILHKGYMNKKLVSVSGLSLFLSPGTISENDLLKIMNFYNIEDIIAEELLNKKIKSIKWTHEKVENKEIFNKYLKEPLSRSFSLNYELREKDITMYKANFNDYGFIKKENGKYYINQLSKYEIDEREVRRYQYALKSSVNNAQIALYLIKEEDNVCILKLYSALPKLEESILMFFGWPVKNINDRMNFIFSLSVWSFIKHLLENLNIELKGEY